MVKKKELLRKQLELLAEQSKSATDNELARLSVAMCEVYRELKGDDWRYMLVRLALLCTMGLYLLICILVHI